MGLLGGISDAVSSVKDTVTHAAGSVTKKVTHAVSSGVEDAVDHADDFGDSVRRGVDGLTHGKTGFSALSAVAGSVTDKIGDGLSSGFDAVKKGVKKYGPEALKIGVVVGAGALGGAIGGPAGAALAGGLASAFVSAYDQKRKTGKIDFLKTGLSGVLGAVPGGGGVLAKVGGKALASGTAKTALTHAADGASFGFRFGAGETIYDGAKKGDIDWHKAFAKGAQGALSGAVTGGLVGGVSGRLISRKAVKSAENPPVLQPPVTGVKTKTAPQYLGGSVPERVQQVFGKTAAAPARQPLQEMDDFKAYAAEALSASPTGMLVGTADQLGKQWLLMQFQNADFLA